MQQKAECNGFDLCAAICSLLKPKNNCDELQKNDFFNVYIRNQAVLRSLEEDEITTNEVVVIYPKRIR